MTTWKKWNYFLKAAIAFLTIALLSISLGACGNTSDIDFYSPEDNQSLSICSPEQVGELKMRIISGSATVRVTTIHYESHGVAYSTPVEYKVIAGQTVPLPFCQPPGIGNVSFQMEIESQGEIVFVFEEMQHADLHLWDGNSFDDQGPSVGASASGFERFTVAIEWWQF